MIDYSALNNNAQRETKIVIYKPSFLFTLFKRKKYNARIASFARQNGFSAYLKAGTGLIHGVLQTAGHDQKIVQRVVANHNQQKVMVSNVQYATGNAPLNQTLHRIGVVEVVIAHRLPNMVLEAKTNARLGGTLPIHLDRDQILHLEGDFDKYFTLYAPKQYERDALYVFTPDTMGTLIDSASNFNVEVVDYSLMLYTNGWIALDEQSNWEAIFNTVERLTTQINKQAAQWRDEREPAKAHFYSHTNPGRRLKSDKALIVNAVTVLAGIITALLLVTHALPSWVATICCAVCVFLLVLAHRFGRLQ